MTMKRLFCASRDPASKVNFLDKAFFITRIFAASCPFVCKYGQDFTCL